MTDLLIRPALDAYLVATNENREPDDFFHPSSLFQCDRAAVYNKRGTPETDPKEPEDLRVLAIGKALHALIQLAVALPSASADARIVQSWSEVKVLDPDLRIKGSADTLVELADGTFEVEEFKSAKNVAVKYAKGQFQPKKEHISQALTYVRTIRRYPWTTEDGVVHEPLGDRLRSARVTYLLKDDLTPLEFVYDITPEWEASLESYIRMLDGYQGDALPPRAPREDDGRRFWLCRYCPWRTRCWDSDGEGVELP